jgi:XTP/dITP diphosphohydrolase
LLTAHFQRNRVKMCTSPIPLLVSTRNQHKLREIRTILGARFEVADLSILPTMHEVEETGTSFEENGDLKAVAASQLFEGWVIADDSGLEVDALGGSPGVYSARYAGETASDSENNALLLKNLKEIPEQERRARFRCVIVLARAGRKLAAFSGVVEGLIASSPRGREGFGYDPLFIPDGFSETFGELPVATKNRLSHRARALNQLRAWRGWS